MHSDRRSRSTTCGNEQRRNIDLRIQRFDDGQPTGLSMVNIFGFPDDEPPIGFSERLRRREVSAGKPFTVTSSFERPVKPRSNQRTTRWTSKNSPEME